MRTLLAGAVLLLIAGTAAADGPDRIVIPHGTHFENDVDCATCHEGVAASTSAAERFRPEMDLCADCHDTDDDETCVLCHTNPDEAGDYPARPFGAGLFSHAAHAGAGLECAACHGDPAGEPVLPAKADCRACHATGDDFADCALCHEPAAELRPATHDALWVNLHGAAALEDRDRCALCHTETGCQECHEGDNVRPRSHHLNYAFEHALDARGKELDCYVCHQDPEYCSACHATNRVMPRDHSSAGWLNASGGDHAVEGLFDLESCIACHDAGDRSPSCARCHGG